MTRAQGILNRVSSSKVLKEASIKDWEKEIDQMSDQEKKERKEAIGTLLKWPMFNKEYKRDMLLLLSLLKKTVIS